MPATARNVVQSWIVQGKVVVSGKVVSKPGTPVSTQAKIDILAVEQQYVCRYAVIASLVLMKLASSSPGTIVAAASLIIAH